VLIDPADALVTVGSGQVGAVPNDQCTVRRPYPAPMRDRGFPESYQRTAIIEPTTSSSDHAGLPERPSWVPTSVSDRPCLVAGKLSMCGHRVSFLRNSPGSLPSAGFACNPRILGFGVGDRRRLPRA